MRQILKKISCKYITEEFTTQLGSYHTFISIIKFYKLTLSKTRRIVNIINNVFLKTALALHYNYRSLEKLKLCWKCSQQLLFQVKNLVQNVGSRLFWPALSYELYIWILYKTKQNPQPLT